MQTFDQYQTPQELNDSHQRSSSERKSQQAEAVLESLYAEFAKIYRNAFTNQYAWEDRDAWARQLKGVSLSQLENGFDRLRDDPNFETFPPNPIEFYCLCIGRDRPQRDDDGNDATWQHKRIEAADRANDTKALPNTVDNEHNRQVGRDTLDSLRKLMADTI